ncbi:hypothetical protein [Variovorax saccharolyticus]|uniref:hypothetical protein n=1 Tax=Variovorax saccharolyticus TaxID=3053516 RepID=UPI0025751A7D|nr:hypothetical protein [Variovorax sp. J31P216]MDM0028891.1 hypothetical protein [Variovorax sp. J31P216]
MRISEIKTWKLLLPLIFAFGTSACLAASEAPAAAEKPPEHTWELPPHPPTVENVSKGVLILRGFGETVSNIRVGVCKPDVDIKTSLLCDVSYDTDLPASKYVDKARHKAHSGPHLVTLKDGQWRVQPFTEKYREARRARIEAHQAGTEAAAQRVADYRGWASPLYAVLSFVLFVILWVKLPRMSWHKYDWKAGSGSMPTAVGDGSLAGNSAATSLNAMNGLNLGSIVALVALGLGVVGWFLGTMVLGHWVLEFARYPEPIDTTWVRVAGAFWVLICMRALKVFLGSMLIAGVVGGFIATGLIAFQLIHWILFSNWYQFSWFH